MAKQGVPTILVALDMSPATPALVQYAWDMTSHRPCEMHFLHILPRVSQANEEAAKRTRDDALQALQTATGLPPGYGSSITAITHQIRLGHPAREVVQYAKECQADTIVLGTRGRSRFANMMLGSVAHDVIRDAPCPVTVIPENCLAGRQDNLEPATSIPGSFEELFTGEATDRTMDDNRVIELLRRAMQWRATDIHIDPTGPDRTWIRFRVDGKLRTFCYLDQNLAGPLLMQLRLMANLDTTQTFEPQEARLQLPPPFNVLEVRVTIVPAIDGDAVAMRVLKHEAVPRPLGSLGMSERNLAAVADMLHNRAGLVLVTGPTGTGKTTTVYAMLETLGTGIYNIVSIEDPVEYKVPGIRQMSVNARHGLTLNVGLKTLLRMDPDVVFIGEIRDYEALEIAMRASSSGRYVFSTLHTRDVASTITALRDLHADNHSLAANLTGIVSQRLIRCLCRSCRFSMPVTDDERTVFLEEGIKPPEELWDSQGCEECQHTGFRDRIGVFEAAVSTDKLRAAIQHGVPEDELRRVIRETDFHSLRHDALLKACEGLTSFTEACSLGWI